MLQNKARYNSTATAQLISLLSFESSELSFSVLRQREQILLSEMSNVFIFSSFEGGPESPQGGSRRSLNTDADR